MTGILSRRWLYLAVLLIFTLLSACIQEDHTNLNLADVNPTDVNPTDVRSEPDTHTPSPAATFTNTVTPPRPPTRVPAAETDSPTAVPASEICSPLEGIDLDELPNTIGNPFNPPAQGSDDPHQGIDLADRLAGSQVTLTGRAVLAVMNGQVAGIIQDRFPYGNAVLLEVPLAGVELDTLGVALPTPLAAPLVHPALTCPQVDLPYPPNAGRSLYFLYAHMSEISGLQPGQRVSCGEQVGLVGDSGNALNPHLHLEVRVGPSQARFDSLAHYDNRATQAEMGLYCLWRVSGIFQLMNPGLFLKLEP